MHDISQRISPTIESLYVKSFSSYGGPELAIRQIFLKARQMAPCLLIFEDIDSLVSPMVRSYFLNEVDGLESNHGILMIGSTNHLERLDPGISKRPSRFDRKYFFDVPTRDERIQYADYWRHKLRNNKKVDFPAEMSPRVADLTADFSFAYMKEAFVASLLVIVARSSTTLKNKNREDNLSGNILWKELKKQIDALRKEMDGEDEDSSSLSMASQFLPAMSGIMDRNSSAMPMEISSMNPAFVGANYAGQRPEGCYIPHHTPNTGGMPRYM
jgi:transitional endoplasmic reticulum ATPase